MLLVDNTDCAVAHLTALLVFFSYRQCLLLVRSRGVVASAAAATLKGGAFVVLRALRPFMPAAAGGLLVGLLSLLTALAQSTSDIFPVKDWTAA